MASTDTSRISPTAHYTGYVWCRYGLSPRAFATAKGRVMFEAMRGPMAVARLATGGTNLETLLLQRHKIIDHHLAQAIDEGRITQVVEVAAGISGRGLRFAKRYPGVRYLETDLPGMARHKRALLGRVDTPDNLEVHTLNALEDDGPASLAAVATKHLDPAGGLAIITEGLLSYFGREEVLGMWRRFAAALSAHPEGLYLSDVHLDGAHMGGTVVRAFRELLKRSTRGDTHLHFLGIDPIRAIWRDHGAASVRLHRPRVLAPELNLPIGWGPDFVGVLEVDVRGGSSASGSTRSRVPPR